MTAHEVRGAAVVTLTTRLEFTVVAPAHNERGCLPAFIDDVGRCLAGHAFELIVVDDGSTDGSSELLADLAGTRPWLVPIRLHRNQGQTAAMAAGIDAARADLIVTIDSDGQNDPADIPMLVEELVASDADIVAGRRLNRAESASRRVVSAAANRISRRITGVDLHDSGCSLKVFRAAALADLALLRDDHRFLPALSAARNATVREVPVNDRPRLAGASHYGFSRIPKVAIDLIGLWTSHRFRGRPLRLGGWMAVALLSLWTAIAAVAWLAGQAGAALIAAGLGATFATTVALATAMVETHLRYGSRP